MLNTADISKLVKNDSVVEFVIRKVKVDELGAELKEKIGNRPVIDISVVVDGKKVEWSNYKAKVKISIPYKPDAKSWRTTSILLYSILMTPARQFPYPAENMNLLWASLRLRRII